MLFSCSIEAIKRHFYGLIASVEQLRDIFTA